MSTNCQRMKERQCIHWGVVTECHSVLNASGDNQVCCPSLRFDVLNSRQCQCMLLVGAAAADFRQQCSSRQKMGHNLLKVRLHKCEPLLDAALNVSPSLANISDNWKPYQNIFISVAPRQRKLNSLRLERQVSASASQYIYTGFVRLVVVARWFLIGTRTPISISSRTRGS